MGEGASWVARAFALFDGLINSRRPQQPNQSVATAPGECPTPEGPADDSAASLPRPELAFEADAPARSDDSKIETSLAEQIEGPPTQRDDESRRKLIRQLFNEYWTGIEDKPATFAERLEIAEGYINERLADRDVGWRLDGVTRKQLGLPSSPMDS
jgi:hypothetical protein